MEDKERQAYIEEYEQIQKLRGLWSGFVMDWMRIGVPVGGVLFGLFSYLGETVSWLLPILGWLIFITPMIMWRFMAHHIDRQIVEMYPRMLELEQKLGWVTHATYYYHNLKKKTGQRFIKDRLGSFPRDYRQYERIKKLEDPYQLLLDVWDKHGPHSVTTRGHVVQDGAVGFVSIISLAIACFLAHSLICPQYQVWVIVIGLILAIGVLLILLRASPRRWVWN